MSFYADIHIHSKYSRATSKDCDLEHLAFWAKAVRERQLGLAPSAITLASEGPTLASTVLAETR